MPRRVLTDEFDVTFNRDELITALQLVRREIRDIPEAETWNETSVWRSKYLRLRAMEDKIVTAYNISGTRVIEGEDNATCTSC